MGHWEDRSNVSVCPSVEFHVAANTRAASNSREAHFHPKHPAMQRNQQEMERKRHGERRHRKKNSALSANTRDVNRLTQQSKGSSSQMGE